MLRRRLLTMGCSAWRWSSGPASACAPAAPIQPFHPQWASSSGGFHASCDSGAATWAWRGFSSGVGGPSSQHPLHVGGVRRVSPPASQRPGATGTTYVEQAGSSGAAETSTSGAANEASGTIATTITSSSSISSGSISSGSISTSSTSSSAAASSSPSLLAMDKEVPGTGQPMFKWEKWYWFLIVVPVSAFLYARLGRATKSKEELQAEAAARAAARAELEAKRKQYLRTLFMNEAHFIQDWEDPLEGLTPTQIEELVRSAGISPDDPFEGMTPEEIDAFMATNATGAAAGEGATGEAPAS